MNSPPCAPIQLPLNTRLGDGRNATDAGRPVGKRSSGARTTRGRSRAERARQAEPTRGSLRGRERRAGDARAALWLRRELRPDGHEGQHADARGGREGPADGVPLSRAARLQLEGEERRGRDGAHAGQVGRPEGVHEGVPQSGGELRALCRRGRDPRRHRREAQRAVGHPPLRLRYLCIEANSLSTHIQSTCMYTYIVQNCFLLLVGAVYVRTPKFEQEFSKLEAPVAPAEGEAPGEAAAGGSSGKVSTDDFLEVLRLFNVPLQPEFAEDCLKFLYFSHDPNKTNLLDFREFISGKKYMSKNYLIGSFVPKQKKKKKAKGKKGTGRRRDATV